MSLCTTVTTVFEATALLKFRWIPAQAALSADFTGRESGGQKVPLFFFHEGCSPSPRFYSHLPIICKDTRGKYIWYYMFYLACSGREDFGSSCMRLALAAVLHCDF